MREKKEKTDGQEIDQGMEFSQDQRTGVEGVEE